MPPCSVVLSLFPPLDAASLLIPICFSLSGVDVLRWDPDRAAETTSASAAASPPPSTVRAIALLPADSAYFASACSSCDQDAIFSELVACWSPMRFARRAVGEVVSELR